MLELVSPYVEFAAVCISFCFLLSPTAEVAKVCRSNGKALKDVNPLNLILMCVNSALWLWYGIFCPIPPAVLSNVVGFSACCGYLGICWYYARHGQEPAWGTTAATRTLLAFCVILLALVYAAWSHVAHVGFLAMVVNILTYGAPLSLMGRVVSERCSSCLPPLQCFLALACSSLWLLVGLHRRTLPMIIPNAFGVPLALLQIFLLWRFPREHPGDSLGASPSTSPHLARPLPIPQRKGYQHQDYPYVVSKVAVEAWQPKRSRSLRESYLQRFTRNSVVMHKSPVLVGICTDAESP